MSSSIEPAPGTVEQITAAREAAVVLLTCAHEDTLSDQLEHAVLGVALADPAHRILVAFLLVEHLSIGGPSPDGPMPDWAAAAAAALRAGDAGQVKSVLQMLFGEQVHPADATEALFTLARATRADPASVRAWAAAAAAAHAAEAGRDVGRR